MAQGKGRFQKAKKEKPEFDQSIVDLARVTRVTEGGKQLNFRACVVIGDRKGRVGYGVDKGKDVQIAVEKAVNQAKKNIIRVPLHNDTIPHRVDAKFKAAKLVIQPAPRGSGIIAGGAVRVILEMAGVPNASAKMLARTKNKVTNVKATFAALTSFLPSERIGQRVKQRALAKQAIEAKKETSEVKNIVKKAPARKVKKEGPADNKA